MNCLLLALFIIASKERRSMVTVSPAIMTSMSPFSHRGSIVISPAGINLPRYGSRNAAGLPKPGPQLVVMIDAAREWSVISKSMGPRGMKQGNWGERWTSSINVKYSSLFQSSLTCLKAVAVFPRPLASSEGSSSFFQVSP